MARIAVIFGTTDGQTAKIARHVVEVLRSEQHVVDLIDTRAPPPSAPLEGVHAAVIAGSVRMGKFQRPLVEFVREHRDALAGMPTAFLPVSISAMRSTPPALREVKKTIERFIKETGLTPGYIQPTAGALVYTRYPFFTKIAMILISKMAGGDTDTSRDYEYTDWNAVSEFAHRFAEKARGSREAQYEAGAPA
ncbi:MAG TPA: flavodoxin domain-containing protein [Myxococcales bacterium]|nr:flavodoxin domain-containing protein [Myxococcales bacterium]